MVTGVVSSGSALDMDLEAESYSEREVSCTEYSFTLACPKWEPYGNLHFLYGHREPGYGRSED